MLKINIILLVLINCWHTIYVYIIRAYLYQQSKWINYFKEEIIWTYIINNFDVTMLINNILLFIPNHNHIIFKSNLLIKCYTVI